MINGREHPSAMVIHIFKETRCRRMVTNPSRGKIGTKGYGLGER
jgi:hypothetical protein